jgi:hypothetical protein
LKKFPENIEAVDELIQLSRRLGDDSSNYVEMLVKLRPKPEIEYDPTTIAVTPRPRHFQRISPSADVKNAPSGIKVQTQRKTVQERAAEILKAQEGTDQRRKQEQRRK